MRRILVPTALSVLLLATHASPLLAAWPNSALTNLPVCTATNTQQFPTSVPDGAGGAIVTWQDLRYDIYAQHVLATGTVDPAWPVNGRALCTAANNQSNPAIVADGVGGAIVAWEDARGGATADLYAQHVLGSGVLDPGWPADGRALCVAVDDQSNVAIAADGAGGAIVFWRDRRSGTNYDIYAHHLLGLGAVDPAWPSNGRALCTAAGDQSAPTVVQDRAGGAIVAWSDERAGNLDIFAHHVLAGGLEDPSWPTNGLALCTAAYNQYAQSIVSDGAGGAIVTWQDARSATSLHIYAQHVFPGGLVDQAWPSDGQAVCTAANGQQSPKIASDGAAGALITWYDNRSGNFDIYVQHVLASGIMDPAWPVDGRAIYPSTNWQLEPTIVSDGAGGAIVTWHDFRSTTSYDTYAHHVANTGVVDVTWPSGGRALSTATGDQVFPGIISDDAGGAIIAWQDARNGAFDIYAQRVARSGFLGTPEPEITSVKDVPNDQGGVVLVSWAASYLEPSHIVTTYRIYRSVAPNVLGAMRKRGVRVVASEDSGTLDAPGDVLTIEMAGFDYYWEYMTNVSATLAPSYAYAAATGQDSSVAGAPTTAFLVQCRASGNRHWESRPMSGYSVDNIPPAALTSLSGEYLSGTARLHWTRNREVDLAGYRVYRDVSMSFVPGPATLVATLTDTGYVDPAGIAYVYKLTAVDAHGNESPVAALAPGGAAEEDPRQLSFAPPSPNPVRETTTLRFALPRTTQVRLAVYDAAGRLVRELVQGPRGAGRYTEDWDLRDATGRGASPGVYFARLEVGSSRLLRRIVVAR